MARDFTGQLVMNGHDLWRELGLVPTADTDLGNPEAKVVTASVPYGEDIDLTDALTGGPTYGDRDMTIVARGHASGRADYEAKVSRLRTLVHGRRCAISLAVDPGYTYDGRVTIKGASMNGGAYEVTMSVHARPWKSLGRRVLRLSAAGGRWFRVEGGTRPVRPTIECDGPVGYATRGGAAGTVGAGTHVLRDVVIRAGINELYLKTSELDLVRWDDAAEGEAHALTWDGAAASAVTWDGVQLLGIDDEWQSLTWDDASQKRWDDLSQERWSDLRPPVDKRGPEVYLTYEWEDL